MQNVFVISQHAFDAVVSAENAWQEMFKNVETARVVDMHSFHGGIDHTDLHKKRIVFHDIGCNGKGSDLVLMRSINLVGPENHPIWVSKTKK